MFLKNRNEKYETLRIAILFPMRPRPTVSFVCLLILSFQISSTMQSDQLDETSEVDEGEMEDRDTGESDGESYTEELTLGDDGYKYVIVDASLLVGALRHCVNCGAAPLQKQSMTTPGSDSRRKRKSRAKPGRNRKIKWTKVGTSLTARFRCKCSGMNKISWSSQVYLNGSQTRAGNVRVVAAAQMSGISYAQLGSFFGLMEMPLMSKQSFNRISSQKVRPVIRDEYYSQMNELIDELKDEPIDIDVDGQFDSPGEAEHCAVSVIVEPSKMILSCTAIHKSEVGNVSRNMEREATRRAVQDIESAGLTIRSITSDKNAQVVADLKVKESQNPAFRWWLDSWHWRRALCKWMKSTRQTMKDAKDREEFVELCKRMLRTLYHHIEIVGGDPRDVLEGVMSLFLHVQGIHKWDEGSQMSELLHPRKPGTKFAAEIFTTVVSCVHDEDYETENEPVDPSSLAYQTLLDKLAMTATLNDLERLRGGVRTAHNENFHSVVIKYRPKRLSFTFDGFCWRTMLAVLHHNETRRAELRGERQIVGDYECFSKAKGQMHKRVKKDNGHGPWKIEMVEEMLQYQPAEQSDESEFEDEIPLMPADGQQVLENMLTEEEEDDEEEL